MGCQAGAGRRGGGAACQAAHSARVLAKGERRAGTPAATGECLRHTQGVVSVGYRAQACVQETYAKLRPASIQNVIEKRQLMNLLTSTPMICGYSSVPHA